MVRGHSGSGPRNTEHEPPVLSLTEEYRSSSPETPLLLVETPQSHFGHPGKNLLPLLHNVKMRYSTSPTLLPPLSTTLSAALTSSFSSTYNQIYAVEDDIYQFPDDNNLYAGPPPYIPLCASQWLPDDFVHCIHAFAPFQYLLDKLKIPEIISETVPSHRYLREAVLVLASVHRNGDKFDPAVEDGEHYHSLCSSLLDRRSYTVDDALTALLIVWSFFGVGGPWQKWLQVTYIYADSVLLDPRHPGPADALMKCDEKMAFVIKTALWFDVLASVTTQEPPHFLHPIRLMFSPSCSGIHDLSDPQLSMMKLTGCENHIIWALAETSYLLAWKQTQIRRRCLRLGDLLEIAADIQASLLRQPMAEPYHHDIDYCRHVTSEIFRSSARVYLLSVLLGDYPFVPETRESVEDTLRCIQLVPNVSSAVLRQTALRSTVFSIFICGCLTDDACHRKVLLDHLDRETGECVGRLSRIRQLLERVWETRAMNDKLSSVRWLEVLKEQQIVLV